MGAEVHHWGPDGGLDGGGPPGIPPEAGDVRALASPATLETARRLKTAAGIDDPAREHQPLEHPDVSGLAEGLGLK